MDPSYILLQNPDTIVDAHKCWLTGAGYSYHLGGSPMHDKYRAEHSLPATELSTRSAMGELEKGLKELKGFAAP